MAKVNLERRAEIGQEKRARTRAQLIAAASALFAQRSWASVTIDDLVREARVAKGTFYVHFEDMHALTGAVAGELIHSFDEMIQGRRASTSDPLLRVAFGCDAFIERALEDPALGALVARMARSNPSVGETTRRRLKEDLARVLDALPGGGLSVDLALEAATGVVLQVLAAIGDGRLHLLGYSGTVGPQAQLSVTTPVRQLGEHVFEVDEILAARDTLADATLTPRVDLHRPALR